MTENQDKILIVRYQRTQHFVLLTATAQKYIMFAIIPMTFVNQMVLTPRSYLYILRFRGRITTSIGAIIQTNLFKDTYEELFYTN